MRKLQAAEKDPHGPEAREVLSVVLHFLKLSSRKVPHGPGERAGEMAKYFAEHTYCGPANMFYSAAPNDVHDPFQIRYATAYTGPEVFPAVAPPEFYAALRGSSDPDRKAYAQRDCDEDALQALAAQNPIACALAVQRTITAVHRDLLGLDIDRSDSKSDARVSERTMGIYGRLATTRCVKETNARMALHLHGQCHWRLDSSTGAHTTTRGAPASSHATDGRGSVCRGRRTLRGLAGRHGGCGQLLLLLVIVVVTQ
jgi:hypothetical protein